MIVAIFVTVMAVLWALFHPRETAKTLAKLIGKDINIVPALINYRITTKCNSKCDFCSHRVKPTSHVESLDNIKRGLLLLKQAGMKRINFTGGEPLMHPSLLIEAIIYCKEELGLRSVAVTTNGSLLTGHFIFRTAQCLDSITVACDMFDQNQDYRYCCGSGGHPRRMEQASRLCRLYGIKFKIHTLVNQYNVDEDMNAYIRDLQPFRWTCSPVLVCDAQNEAATGDQDDDSDDDDDDAEAAAAAAAACITHEEFRHFRMRHRHNKHFIAGRKKAGKGRYLLVDEYMQILDEETGVSSQSILEVGVERALDEMR